MPVTPEIQGTKGQYTLLEHEADKWIAPNELQSVKWLPADEDLIEELSR